MGQEGDAMIARLPTPNELCNLYSRAEVRASLGWSDEKLRRRLLRMPEIRPSGSGRGQQFTGADILALFQGGIEWRPDGSKRTPPANIAGVPAGMSEVRTSTAARSRAASRPRSLLRELLDELPSDFYATPTVVPLTPPRSPRR